MVGLSWKIPMKIWFPYMKMVNHSFPMVYLLPNGWFIMENPNLKWIIWGYPYDLGNLQIFARHFWSNHLMVLLFQPIAKVIEEWSAIVSYVYIYMCVYVFFFTPHDSL